MDVDVPEEIVDRSNSVVVERNATGTRLRLAPGEDALELLDAIRDRARVTEFGVDAPTSDERGDALVSGSASDGLVFDHGQWELRGA
ncbi:MAG: hypothetical protein OSA99_03570 [Acidimicrobiales bacterium]|nr:hypothetical protein [Acidimicrobiales bacterium]